MAAGDETAEKFMSVSTRLRAS
jgi:hypothetical protein